MFFMYYYWLSLTRKCQKISSKDSFINYKLFFLQLQGSMRDGSGDVSPKDTKTSDLMSEADSNDGLASGIVNSHI